MKLQHKHLLVNGDITKPLANEQSLIDWLTKLVLSVNMKITMGPMAYYVDVVGNKGLTGVVGLETSHASIHIWDEKSPAMLRFDLYTCGALNANDVLDMMRQDLGLINEDVLLLDREDGFIQM